MTTARARELRQTMTVQERRLWSRLKQLREQGFRFRRQAPFRGYYLDFVCFDRWLVIELDGRQHNDDRQLEHDAVRDTILRREGFVILRFWNSAVNADIGTVMDGIVRVLEDAPSKHADWRRPVQS